MTPKKQYLPDSAWNILSILNREMSIQEIVNETGMHTRTARYSLLKLHNLGDIGIRINFKDMRGYIYFRV